jgi:lysyl-tRNA synthetase class 2
MNPASDEQPDHAALEPWRPSATLAALRLRAELYATIRAYFAERGVLEVETPILSTSGNTDPNIESFTLDFHGPAQAGGRQRWLRTSPEFALKRLLAAGVGDCYELGRVFRNGEAGRRHNPEFSMLEWYRVGWDHRRLIDECVELVQAALALVGRRAAVECLSYAELFQRELGIDPHRDPLERLQAPLQAYAINADGLGRDDWLDLLLTHRIEVTLPADGLTVVRDYPASQCALARVREGDPPVAERFEVYLGRIELANGYHELNDGQEQAARFQRDLRVRGQRGGRLPPVDEHLLAALQSGLPDCAGVALGIDRLLMAMGGGAGIGEVLAFDFGCA